ncbi:caspase family protein [Amycolatopsis sp. NPDC089917]|uniref:caspase, EACC1-associated type n=1 Tax=Amycolatopsis sp. NPDC089917 TaxID=3155187 RepID=UPI00342919AF
MAVLPDAAGTHAVLIGVSEYDSLPDLPGVANNLTTLRELFTARDVLGLPEDNCVLLTGSVTPDDLDRAISGAAAAASDTLIVYYSGHGLIDEHDGTLYLASRNTETTRVHATATPYEWIRRAIMRGPARRVVILDCCFSGRALNSMDGRQIAAMAAAEGTAVLAAAHENRMAVAPQDEPHTAFTAELVQLLGKGIPDGPELLDVDEVFNVVSRALRAKGRPIPQGAFRNTAKDLALGRNRAWVRPDVVIHQPPTAHGSGSGAGRGQSVLTISEEICEAMIAHVRRVYPRIACGMVVGPKATGLPERLIEITNRSTVPVFWEFDPFEQLQAFKEMAENDEEHVILYHSRVEAGAYLSKADVTYLDEERSGRHLVIVAIPDPDSIELRAHRVAESRIMEEEIRVVRSYP